MTSLHGAYGSDRGQIRRAIQHSGALVAPFPVCYTTRVIRKYLPLILDTLATVALAIWLGAVVTLLTACRPGAFVLIFGPALAQSSRISLEVCRGAASLVEGSGFVLIAAQYVLRRRYQGNREMFIADGVRQLFTFGALFTVFYMRINILNKINFSDARDLTGTLPTIRSLFLVQVVLLVAAAAITTWLQIPRLLPPPTGSGSPIPPTGPRQNAQTPGQPRQNKARQQRRSSR